MKEEKAWGRRKDFWVSVKDEKPDERFCESVLVWVVTEEYPRGTASFAVYDGGGRWYFGESEDGEAEFLTDSEVRYWARIPAIPDGEVEG